MSSYSESTRPDELSATGHSNVDPPVVIPEMLFFDIDGVITEPVTGEVEPEVVNEIVGILERGEPVAFNTGRGLQWVLRDILPHFERKVSKRSILTRLCIVYQKGAFLVTFDEKGVQEKPVVAPDVALLPNFFRDEALQLIATKYSDTMYPGEEKEALLSPQYKPGSDFAQYKADQARLVDELQVMLQRYGLHDKFRVDPTRIATDVEDRCLGKALGAQRVLEWLKEQGLRPGYFITFGDSKSDVSMAEEIFRQGFPVELVFVGEEEELQAMQLPFPVFYTKERCEKGTLQYLKNRFRKEKL